MSELNPRDLAAMSSEELVTNFKRSTDPGEAELLFGELLHRREDAGQDIARALIVDAKAAPELRTMAAVGLAQRATEDNEMALVDGLRSRDAILVRRSAVGLGKIGTPQALGELERAQRTATGPGSKSIRFARTLISYRFGLDVAPLTPPAMTSVVQLDDARSTELERVELPENAFEDAEKDLASELPAIEVSSMGSLRMACLGEQLWFVLTEAAQQGEERINNTSAVLAAVLKRSTCSERWFLHEYILSHPAPRDSGSSVDVFGVRTTSRMVHYGYIYPSDGAGVLSLRALDSAGVPALRLEVKYSGEGTKPEVRSARRAPPAARRAVDAIRARK